MMIYTDEEVVQMMMICPVDKEESVTALTLIPSRAGSGRLAARQY